MPFNGSGLFSILNTFVPGTTIFSSAVNANETDIASGLSTAILKNGTQTVTADIPMSAHKFTGLAVGSSAQDSVRYDQVSTIPGSVTTLATALQGLLFGCTLSNDSGGATAIAVAAGAARDSTNADTLSLAAALTGKVLANAWTVGNAGGLLDTGAVANNTYHIYLIKRVDTSVVDAIASLSAAAPNLPANYTLFRRIGSIVRTGGAIKLFTQLGDEFLWTPGPVADIAATNPGTAAVTRTLTLPTGVQMRAIVQIGIRDTTGGSDIAVYVSPLDTTDVAASTVASRIADIAVGAEGGDTSSSGVKHVRTNTSAQVRSRIENSNASTTFYLTTLGWFDTRGRLY